MKTLKFLQKLVPLIQSGEKITTFRLFDDKDLQVGDIVDLFVTENGYQFGVMTITEVIEKPLGALEESDWVGHERYASEEEMYSQLRTFYGSEVGPATKVKIIRFTFEPKLYNKVVVVDEDDNVIGSEYMRIAVEKGLIRRASCVYVFNESGQILIQQRSAKVAKPLMLDQSAAGHVDDGETYEEAARRELKEELGLEGYELKIVATSFRDRDSYNGIYKVVVKDSTPINFDPEELAQVMWWSPEHVDEAMTKTPDKFTPAFTGVWSKLKDKIIAT